MVEPRVADDETVAGHDGGRARTAAANALGVDLASSAPPPELTTSPADRDPREVSPIAASDGSSRNRLKIVDEA
ncbi:hypothetical protein ACFQ7N_10755 [Streptomyces niveus]|uniref:hypothetical protein n=1 Tax=Streptomyces niveus TaxID=193462 RepID=UPI0036CF00D6